MGKIIVIDYDGTYTQMPELIEAIITKAKDLGYRVVCATMRFPEETDEGLESLRNRIEVYFTSRQAKRAFLHAKGIIPDLWVDDNPYWILCDADQSFSNL